MMPDKYRERGESSFALGSWKGNTTFAVCEAAGGLLRRDLFVQSPGDGSGLLVVQG